MSEERSATSEEKPTSLWELARLFLKLGTIAFGGPAAHVGMMEDEVVRRRGWLSRERFMDLFGATNLIPGPNSTELAIHIGHQRGGWKGLVVAGTCFILPAMIIVIACAWTYVTYGSLPQVEGVLLGVKPIIIAVVLQALWSLGKTAVKNAALALIGATAVVLAALGVHELIVLFGAGIVVASGRFFRRRFGKSASMHDLAAGPLLVWMTTPVAGPSLWTLASTSSLVAAAPLGLGPLFLFFVKIGAVLFGSGYVLLAFLRADLVERWQWLTESQLLDAVAVGQVTPGPVFTTATFIGYVLLGLSGAVVATVGIFLPAFCFVALSAPFIPKLRQSVWASSLLDGINVASLALMIVVTWYLARSALVNPFTWVIALLGAVLLLRWKVNSAYLVIAGGVLGFAYQRFIGL